MLADVAEAMTSVRPYHTRVELDVALKEIEGKRGTAHNPVVADACLRLFRETDYSIPA